MAALFLKTEELNEVDIDNILELKDNEVFSAMENGITNKKMMPSDSSVINMS
jgi:hypothetical protein